MAEEFGGLGRLKRLKEDAEKAAAVLDEVEETTDKKTAEKVVDLDVPKKAKKKTSPRKEKAEEPKAPTKVVVVEEPQPPVSLSTLVFAPTKKLLARVAHLQAANEESPSTQWEIVDQAINEWCENRGYK